jgi:hypothetical protein
MFEYLFIKSFELKELTSIKCFESFPDIKYKILVKKQVYKKNTKMGILNSSISDEYLSGNNGT